MAAHSANYDYVLEAARRLAGVASPRVLDFGCGLGETVRLGLARGLDIHGADTFCDHFESWQDLVAPEIRDRIRKIDGALPFPDSFFDVVVSNQVFEHIADPPGVLPEIRRVLRPGGAFLALFPLRETWYEGHVGLYFAHRLQAMPALQRAYLAVGHRLGFGLYRGDRTSAAWAAEHGRVLQEVCFYHRGRDVRRWWYEAFGEAPTSLAADYVAFRLGGNRVAPLVPRRLRAPLFAATARVRAGAVLLVRNHKPADHPRRPDRGGERPSTPSERPGP